MFDDDHTPNDAVRLHPYVWDRAGEQRFPTPVGFNVVGVDGRAKIALTATGTWQILRIYADESTSGWSGSHASPEHALADLLRTGPRPSR
jgi:hypothetical protein